MLIRAQDLLRRLAEEKSKLMEDTFHSPPSDYAGFSRAVGHYNALTNTEALVRELARQEDDKT